MKLLGGKTVNELIHSLQILEYFKENFSETIRFLGLKFTEMTNVFFFSIFRSVILLASSDDERRMLMRQKDVNKDSPIYMSSNFGGTYQDNSELMQQDGRGKKTANLV